MRSGVPTKLSYEDLLRSENILVKISLRLLGLGIFVLTLILIFTDFDLRSPLPSNSISFWVWSLLCGFLIIPISLVTGLDHAGGLVIALIKSRELGGLFIRSNFFIFIQWCIWIFAAILFGLSDSANGNITWFAEQLNKTTFGHWAIAFFLFFTTLGTTSQIIDNRGKLIFGANVIEAISFVGYINAVLVSRDFSVMKWTIFPACVGGVPILWMGYFKHWSDARKFWKSYQ